MEFVVSIYVKEKLGEVIYIEGVMNEKIDETYNGEEQFSEFKLLCTSDYAEFKTISCDPIYVDIGGRLQRYIPEKEIVAGLKKNRVRYLFEDRRGN